MHTDKAAQLHREALVVDGHCDTVHVFSGIKGPYVFGERNQVGHVDLPRLQEGGVNLQFFALYIEAEFKPCRALSRTMTLMEHFWREMDKHSDRITVVQNNRDLDAVVSHEKIGALLSLEGAEALENPEILHLFYRLGLRSVGLTWNQRNMLADGVGAGPNPGGLTGLGRDMVREMNKLGILIDAAHLAVPGFFDLLEQSAAPIAVTHANAAGVCANRRNLSDDQLRALRDHGGVVGLTFYPPFVTDAENCTMDKLLDHFCYIAEHFGTDLIGLGSDYDGISTAVSGLDDVAALPRLTAALLGRGFSDDEIKKILGGNFLRVIRRTFERRA